MTDSSAMGWYATKAGLQLACLTIGARPCGATSLGVGDVVAVFGRAQPDPPGAGAPARCEMDAVRERLDEAGAEEVCGLTFGGGYVLFVRPKETEREGGLAGLDRLSRFVETLHGLACRASGAGQGLPAGDVGGPAPVTEATGE
jgi:hypothetical protein